MMSSIYKEPIPTREERSAKLKVSERVAEGDRRRDMVVTIAWCFAFMLLGLFLMACAMHTTDAKLGGILFWGALVVNNGGVLWTLVAAFQRGQARGDW